MCAICDAKVETINALAVGLDDERRLKAIACLAAHIALDMNLRQMPSEVLRVLAEEMEQWSEDGLRDVLAMKREHEGDPREPLLFPPVHHHPKEHG
jgi:hypothetical protein